MNPIFAIILDPKPLVCTSNAPISGPLEASGVVSPTCLATLTSEEVFATAISESITPHDTNETGCSAYELFFPLLLFLSRSSLVGRFLAESFAFFLSNPPDLTFTPPPLTAKSSSSSPAPISFSMRTLSLADGIHV
ncbi:hypothetical protein YC2023_068316 [Brassica napus]